MSTRYLQKKIHLYLLRAVILAGVISAFGILALSFVKYRSELVRMEHALLESVPAELDMLLPSILIEEQNVAIDFILSRIQRQEGLLAVQWTKDISNFLLSNLKCNIKTQFKICINSNENTMTIIAPIVESKNVLGYLLKTKRIEPDFRGDQELVNIGVIVLVCILLTVLLFVEFTKITTKELPDIMNSLLNWIENIVIHQVVEPKPDLKYEEFKQLSNGIAKIVLSGQKSRDAIKLGELAAQVAHDIRSPLAALSMIEKDLNTLPEETRLILRHSINRIRDIANHLLLKNKSSTDNTINEEREPVQPVFLTNLVDSIITEKRINYRSKIGIEINFTSENSSNGLFVNLQPTELGRIISNLVNNSVEALDENGTVDIEVKHNNDKVEILIKDNGKGIPPELLSKIGQRGETYGKNEGSGLGLFHAKRKLTEWNGNLIIKSELGLGTSVTIQLPICTPPDWFVTSIQMSAGQNIVVLDDDTSIHEIWRARFAANRDYISLIHISNPNDFKYWILNHESELKNSLFLCDYELLDHDESGLDLIEETRISKQAILVTSRFEELKLRKRCEELGVKLIPKALASVIPIHMVTRTEETITTVLIDDDSLVHDLWKFSAKAAGVDIHCFKSFEAFQECQDRYPKDTQIYIDSNLGKGVKGENLIPILKKSGFSNIVLATGYSQDQFTGQPGLRVVGKEPPLEWRQNS